MKRNNSHDDQLTQQQQQQQPNTKRMKKIKEKISTKRQKSMSKNLS